MAKRVKKTVVSGVTREQADTAFAEFALLDAREQKLTASMDEQITRIREKFQEELQKCASGKEKAFEVIQAYAVENKEELFQKKRSMETPHGVFGFRTGTPKLRTLKGFTWPAVTNLLKAFLPDYVRTTEEPAKDLLLANRDNPEVSQFFPEVGITVCQEEAFFLECRKEEAISQV